MTGKGVKSDTKVANELSLLLKKCNLDQDFNLDDKTSVQNLLIKILKLLSGASDCASSSSPGGNKGARGKNGKTVEGAGGSGVGEGGKGVTPTNQSWLEKLESRMRKQEDFSDFIHQKSLKGIILVFSPENSAKQLKTIIKSPEDLNGETYTEQIIRLVNEHYGVKIPIQDIINCHPTKSGGAIIRFGNRKANSAFDKLCSAIKSGRRKAKEGGVGVGEGESQKGDRGAEEGKERTYADATKNDGKPNFWMTFMLSARRSNMIRELKQLKKNKKIHKFTSDENGEIYMMPKEGHPKIRLTMDWTKPDETKTYLTHELIQLC